MRSRRREWNRTFFILLAAARALAAQQYFPPGVTDSYVKHLMALKEPSLWGLSRKDATAEVYRFLWLRSFDSPISVRLIVTGDGGRLILKMTDGMSGFESGHLIRDRESRLSKEATDWFLGEVKQVNFWDVPSRDKSQEGVDGAQWIIEGVKRGRYHIIERYSPDPKDPAHILGIALAIHLARLRLLYQQVY
ncbi:MAG: hypothetical protein JOZ32_21670 [Bryobacterales bacterium]|nr:hypothetical protein [Bryobacterales bacterium]